jgi:hypothetical protein
VETGRGPGAVTSGRAPRPPRAANDCRPYALPVFTRRASTLPRPKSQQRDNHVRVKPNKLFIDNYLWPSRGRQDSAMFAAALQETSHRLTFLCTVAARAPFFERLFPRMSESNP